MYKPHGKTHKSGCIRCGGRVRARVGPEKLCYRCRKVESCKVIYQADYELHRYGVMVTQYPPRRDRADGLVRCMHCGEIWGMTASTEWWQCPRGCKTWLKTGP